jgi:putative acetyltransferase
MRSAPKRRASLSDPDARSVGPGGDLIIAVEDPRASDVRSLMDAHLEFSRVVTPPGHVYALGIEDLADPSVTLFAARRDHVLLGIGALKQLSPEYAELKSIHVIQEARGQGIARALVTHLLEEAGRRQCREVRLETGTMAAFAPARHLYAALGFVPCAPFGEYTVNPYSTCMTYILEGPYT